MDDLLSKQIGHNIGVLLSLHKKKQKDLAEYLGVKENTISYFVSGKRMPNTEQIVKIAIFFNTTTDYLLGLSNVQNSDTDSEIKKICDYTGLSEKSVKVLNYGKKRLKEEENFSEIMDDFIEKCSSNLVLYVNDYSSYNLFCACYDCKNYDYNNKKLSDEDEIVFDHLAGKYKDYNDFKDLALFRLQELINSFAKEYAERENTHIGRFFTLKALASFIGGEDNGKHTETE